MGARDEETAEISRARLAAIVASSDDVIVSKTLDGIITSWNPAAERLFGWTAAEAIGQHITLIIPEDRLAEEDEVLARIRRGDRVDHFETVRRTKDGRLVDMSITVSPIKDANGRIVGASKIAREIGERRRMEEARTELLRREQAARREAESLNRAKDELLATVSHELRTPLNAIFGWTRMMQSGALDEKGRVHAIDIILRNVTAQTRLIEDLLDLSRIAAGRMRLDFERVDLNGIISTAVETVRPTAAAKGITLVTSLDDSLDAVEGAPDRLQQVVLNLLMNSVKFTPSGGRVEVTSQRQPDSAIVMVSDSGEGISPEALPHVFDPFQQEDSSSTRAKGGLGLGLALVRRLVELHRGHVAAASSGKGGGATFTVTLPLPAAGERARQTDRRKRRETSSHALEGVRVLAVDDDPDFLDLSALVLRRAGAQVRTASSAPRAYELIQSWLPNVLLTDLAMPGEDGFMLAAEMRTICSQQQAPLSIIAVTAYGTPEVRNRAVAAGFDLYLTKPLDPEELVAAAAGIIGKRT